MSATLPGDLRRELGRLLGCYRSGDDPGRDLGLPVSPALATRYGGRRVLVTGGAGAIGAPLARAFAALGARVAALDKDENALAALGRRAPAVGLVLLDVRQSAALARQLAALRPELVVHAAAHKHLPLLEANRTEAFANNAAATAALVRAAEDAGTARLILVSSDKAASPTSVLGASKRAAERTVLGHSGAMRTAVARLANVLGSRGSVLEIWWEERRAGRRLPLTDARMRRRFLTLGASVAFLLAAAADDDGPNRALYVPRRAPEASLAALARAFLAACGAPSGCWHLVGRRRGERLRERLLAPGESAIRL